MAKSARELVNEAIDRLMLYGVGQSVPADNYEKVKAKLWPLLAELKSARILELFVNPIDEDSQDIPDAIFIPLAIALANEAAPSFGMQAVSDPDRVGLWQRLKTAVHAGPRQYRTHAEYY
jgi:hypothetical protein